MTGPATLRGVNPRVTIALMLGVAAVFAGIVALAWPSDDEASGDGQRFEGASLPAGLKAPDFALRDQDGERVSMRALRGKPVIVAFLYSTCEDTCPIQAQQIKGALNELGTDYPALAVSVDPANDSARSAKAFNSKQRMTGRLTWVLGERGAAGAGLEGLRRHRPARGPRAQRPLRAGGPQGHPARGLPAGQGHAGARGARPAASRSGPLT